MKEQESITGRLIRIFNRNGHGFIFKSPDSDFVIGKMHVDELGKDVTVRGEIYDPQFEVDYLLNGSWEETQYGRQFSFSSCSMVMPASESGIYDYLVSNATGIGPSLAKQVIEKFGSETLFILKNEPQKISKAVHGLNLKMAEKISVQLLGIENFEQVITRLFSLLGKFGIRKKRIKKIVDSLGLQADQIVRDNPYALVQIPGLGFILADKVWLSLNKDPHSVVRQCAAGLYCIEQEIGRNGSVWVDRDRIRNLSVSQCGVEISDTSLDHLLADGYQAIFAGSKESRAIERIDGRIGLPEYSTAELAKAERDIAACLAKLNVTSELDIRPLDADDDDQKNAVATILGNQFSILTGSAGSGKSTISTSLLASMAGQINQKVVACAPTGKAARRLSELFSKNKVPIMARTIHKTLEPGTDDGNQFFFQRNAANPIDADVVLIDEVSMVSVDLMASLLRAVNPERTRVIMVGDTAQLPPVGPGAPLRDFCNSDLPHAHLDKVRRAGGAILNAANEVRQEKVPVPCKETNLEEGKNWRHVECGNPVSMKATIDSLYDRLISQYDYNPVWDIQVISPLNERTAVSCQSLNHLLQKKLNPIAEVEGSAFKSGDKVVYRRNMYIEGWKFEPKTADGKLPKTDCNHFVVNGDIGRVIHTGKFSSCVLFYDPNRYCRIPHSDPIHLSYCCTVHVSQGSEWPVVIMVVDKGADILLSRELLYTGMTRAKEYLITVGQMSTFRKAIGREQSGVRQTNLVSEIKNAKSLMEQGYE